MTLKLNDEVLEHLVHLVAYGCRNVSVQDSEEERIADIELEDVNQELYDRIQELVNGEDTYREDMVAVYEDCIRFWGVKLLDMIKDRSYSVDDLFIYWVATKWAVEQFDDDDGKDTLAHEMMIGELSFSLVIISEFEKIMLNSQI